MSGSEMTNVGGVDGGGMQNPPTGPPQPVTQNIPVVAVSEGIAVSTPIASIGSGRGNGSGRGRGRGNGGDNGSGRGRGRGRGNGSGNGNGEKRRGRPRKYGSETSTMAIPLSCAPPGATIATPLPQQHQRIQYRQLPPYHLLQQHQQRQNLQQQEQPQTAPQLQQQPTQPPIQEQQQPPLPQHPPVQQQPPLREEQQPSLPPLQEVHLQPPLPQQLLQEEERQQQQQPQQEEQQPTMPQPQPQQQQQQGGGSQRKVRRRPRGGGRVRQGNPAICGLVGEVFIVNTGEDVSSRILALTQSGASLIFIISAIGSISNATIRAVLPGDSSKTYEGRFDIMSLSGSFRLSDGSGPRNWAGGITVSLTDPDGRVLGGGVAGLLTAASPVQVAVAYNMGDGVAESARPLAVAGPAGPRSSPSHGNLSESAGVAGSPFNQSARAADSTPDPITISDSP